MSALEMRTNLEGIDLFWWPAFLATVDPDDVTDHDSFGLSLVGPAASLAEEDSLA